MNENEFFVRGFFVGITIVLPFLGITIAKWQWWKWMSNFYEDELRYHKYKRCLAMVEWCESRSNKLFEDTLYVRDMGLEPSDELTFKLEFFRKWHKRWLNIAEQLKEAK